MASNMQNDSPCSQNQSSFLNLLNQKSTSGSLVASDGPQSDTELKAKSLAGDQEAKEPKLSLPSSPKFSDAKDQKESKLLHMWWGLIQDQLGTMTREIDSLRDGNTQLQARLTEALMQRSGVQDCMDWLSQLSQDQKNLQKALQAFKDDSCSTSSRLSDIVAAESKRGSDVQEQCDRLMSHVKTSLEEKSLIMNDALEKQGEHMRSLMLALSNDLRSETDQRAKNHEDISAELSKLSHEMDHEKQHSSSCLALLQSQMATVQKEIASEREEWMKQRSELQGNTAKFFGEQQDLNQAALADHTAAEKQVREKLLAQAQQDRQADREAMRKELRNHAEAAEQCHQELEKRVELLSRQFAEESEVRVATAENMCKQLETVSTEVHNTFAEEVRVRKGSMQDLSGQIDMVRGALTQLYADRDKHSAELNDHHKVYEELSDLHNAVKVAHEACVAEVKILGEACADMHSQMVTLQDSLGTVTDDLSNCQHSVKILQEASDLQAVENSSLQEHLGNNDNIASEVQALAQKVSSDLKDQHEACMLACSRMTGEAQQEISASFIALKEMVADEGSLRKTGDEKLEQMLRTNRGDGDIQKQVTDLVNDICAREREQAKALFGHAKQMLESDEELRNRLHGVLQCDMVAKEEFTEQMSRLWQAVNADPPACVPTEGPARFLSVPVAAAPPVANVTPGRERPSFHSSNVAQVQRAAERVLSGRAFSHGPSRERIQASNADLTSAPPQADASTRGLSPLPRNRVYASGGLQPYPGAAQVPSMPVSPRRNMMAPHSMPVSLPLSRPAGPPVPY